MSKPKQEPYYLERPKRGKGKKAWDRYVKEKGERPHSISYTPNYDHEYKGWVCHKMSKDGKSQWIPIYRNVDYDVFYPSSDLA